MMSDEKIARILTLGGGGVCSANDVVVMVGDEKIPAIRKIVIGENGAIEPGGIVEATITLAVRLG